MFYPASLHETLGLLFSSARFVGVFVKDIVGMLGMKGVIIFLIILNVISITLTVLLIKAITKINLYWPIVILYLFLVFSHPGFYINYSYDFFDVLAYLSTISAMFAWYKNRESINCKYLLIIILFIFLSLFSKETYFIPLFIFWFYQYSFSDEKYRKNAVIILGATVTLFLLSILHSHFVSSLWVKIESSKTDPYFINVHPLSIIETYSFYLKMWANSGILGLVALSVAISFLSKKYFKETLLFLVLGLATYIPYSILPNHKFGYYFWLAVPLSYSVILFMNPDSVKLMVHRIGNGDRKLYKSMLAVFVVVSVSFAVLSFKQFNDSYKDEGLQWTLLQESINRNMLANFPYIKNNVSPSDRVLLTGLVFPFHPFVNPNYVDSYFGTSQNIQWVVAVYDDSKKDVSIGTIEFLGVNKIDISKYDKIFVFDAEGNLIRMIEGNKVEINHEDKNDVFESDTILYPALTKYFDKGLGENDWYGHMQVGSVLGYDYPERGEYFLNRAIDLSKETNPYPYYFEGKLLEKLGRNEDALYNYNKAVFLDKSKNTEFVTAVKRIKKVLK